MATGDCITCMWEARTGRTVDTSMSKVAWAAETDVSEAGIRRHLKHKPRAAIAAAETATEPPFVGDTGLREGESDGGDTKSDSGNYLRFSQVPWGYEDHRKFIRSKGQDPDEVTFTWGMTTRPGGGFWNKLNNVRPKTAAEGGEPLWPVIQPAARVTVHSSPVFTKSPRQNGLKLAIKCADHQIGFRALPDGSYDPFHDDRAMALFIAVCLEYQPDKIHVLGDFLDLPSQSRWAQEASFARTTQMALDRAHLWLAELRAACPDAEIIVIEGNHDKRMQTFIETNALAAFGLRRAGLPESWPVMSVQNLLRLDELGVKYIDAYPAATDWDNSRTRNIHGTRANSTGSTMSQYVSHLPHINTWAGHTHRTEIVYKTELGQFGEAIDSYAANPGCMCRTDGSVPSVKAAVGADGIPVKIVEDWQQGFGMEYFNESESWPQVFRIIDGRTMIGDLVLVA